MFAASNWEDVAKMEREWNKKTIYLVKKAASKAKEVENRLLNGVPLSSEQLELRAGGRGCNEVM